MKRTTRSIITWLAVAAMATLVLACQKATPAPTATPVAPAPEEPVPPKPTLLGTWERVHEWRDGDGDLITTTTRLVFAENRKAFWHQLQFDLVGEGRHHPHGNIADYIATEDTITKTFVHDEDDDGNWVSAIIDKPYYLTGSGNVLFVHHWDSDEKEDSFERYTRVKDPVPSNPTLLGTWQRDHVYFVHDDLIDEYVVEGKIVSTLTFTENRYIQVETPRDGVFAGHIWQHSGTWTPATDSSSSVTKTFVADGDRDDDGNWTLETRRYDKEYTWGAGGELFVVEWRGDWESAVDAAAPSVERYTRVETPLLPLVGTWVIDSEGERDGERWTRRETVTIGDVFTYTEKFEQGETPSITWSFSGSYRHDEAKAFLHVDSQSVTYSDTYDAEEAEWYDNRFDGHQVRIAYAPSGIADTMVVSSVWRELQYDENTDTWTDYYELYPHGSYDLQFVRRGP